MKATDRNFQGIWIPKLIYLNTEVNWYAKILFLEIHSFTEHGKECYMSNKYISSFLKISERQVSRYISELKALGWIEEASFDGRKRYLRSMLQFSFRTVDSDLTILSRQHRKFYRNSIDKNDHHNKPITKQHKKSITSLKENIENRSPILE
ncbi:helix-turn-helix domain-containing protein [Maribacter arenosus]|uniref:Helix-turn-helix domain-containing protein n=1 Tax=Maribacter arenosus TaxID=1854708 RepID=A0ABR7VEY8_9FLAO|nr:helix-turn-helix domain-containing protein [Maribacter arenosus]MBD0852189.1 helix-turn-helix domain-containing protein [Maribacter arenosus]